MTPRQFPNFEFAQDVGILQSDYPSLLRPHDFQTLSPYCQNHLSLTPFGQMSV